MKKALAALALIACAACSSAPVTHGGWEAIAVTQKTAAPTEAGVGAKFGDLIFRGGFQLSSAAKAFGGWSSLKIAPDGRLIAISDSGAWLSAKILTDAKSGNFAGLADTKLALVRGEDGAVLATKEAADAEGLAVLPDGRFAVSFEQDHRIEIFDLERSGPTARSMRGPSFPRDGLKPNEGIEALAVTGNGDLIAGSEYAPPGKDSSIFYQLKLGAPADHSVLAMGYAQTTLGNALVDMDRLPDGDLVALERFYFPGIGNKNVIRRYAISGLAGNPPALKGPVLAQFATPQNVDNFEGIAVQALPNGGVRLYIISDDNFSKNQKTLLYAFDLPAKPN